MPKLITRKRAFVTAELACNLLLPWICYRLAKPHLGQVHAIMASAVPPMLWSLVQFARARKIDAISAIVLGGIALSLAGFALGGSPKLLLMRESLVTGLIGVAFIISTLIGKPLMLVLAKASLQRQSPQDGADLASLATKPLFRRMMLVMTLVWGIGFIAETAARATLVFMLPVGRFLIIGPIVGYGTIALLIGWTFLYGMVMEKRGALGDPT